jgi:hypothetical protein
MPRIRQASAVSSSAATARPTKDRISEVIFTPSPVWPSTPMMIEAHRMIAAIIGDLLTCRDDGLVPAAPGAHRRDAGRRQRTATKPTRMASAGGILRGEPANEHALHQHRETAWQRTAEVIRTSAPAGALLRPCPARS